MPSAATTILQPPLEWIYPGNDKVKFSGRYLLGHTDLAFELYFQAAHERWARVRLESRRGGMSEDMYLTDLDGFQEMVNENRFAFGTKMSMRWLLSNPGMVEYLLLKIQKGQTLGGDPIDRDMLTQVSRDDPKAFDEVVTRVLRNDFPNQFGRAPEASAAESPSASSMTAVP
jgi:hypothetical protein